MTDSTETARKTSSADAPHYLWGAACDGWRLLDRPELSVIHERMPPGTSEERHRHERARQLFFVLSGAAVMEAGGRELVLGANEACEVPPGVPHRIRNDGAVAVEFLVISQPSTRGDRIAAGPA